MNCDFDFYKGKRVLVTGHTGFKGSWLCKILLSLGAEVTGYALESNTDPALFRILELDKKINHNIGDIRNLRDLKAVFDVFRPQIVFHLAAQPIVRESYQRPVYTYETNVMGTVNILECVRLADCVESFVNVTTDKVYLNNEWAWGYREIDALDGFDPYSNSKSCSELVTASYKRSFGNLPPISTARAGNVIGGGDFAPDRIIPDCVRSASSGTSIVVRNPHSVRPFQHVLEPLFAYLLLAQTQHADSGLAGAYNIGPDYCDCVTAGEITQMFCDFWGRGVTWKIQGDGGPHEAGFLMLDCSKIKRSLSWQPVWNIKKAVEKTVEFSKAYFSGEDIGLCAEKQINEYLKEFLIV